MVTFVLLLGLWIQVEATDPSEQNQPSLTEESLKNEGAPSLQEVWIRQSLGALPSITIWVDGVDDAGQPVLNFNLVQIDGTIGEHHLSFQTQHATEAHEGVAVTLLIDISKSLPEAVFDDMKQALNTFVNAKQDPDMIGVIAFGEEVEIVQDFTQDSTVLSETINNLQPIAMKTQLHLALSKALAMAERRDATLPDRRAMILLSDGKDEGSGMTLDDLLVEVRQHPIPIYALGYSKLRQDREAYLDQLHRVARISGGVFFDMGSMGFSDAYAQVREDIGHTQRLEFTCETCVGDGRLYPLRLQFTAGSRTLIAEHRIRLWPPTREIEENQPEPASIPEEPEKTNPTYIWVIAGVLALLFGILMLRRRSTAQEATTPIFTPTSRPDSQSPSRFEPNSGSTPLRTRMVLHHMALDYKKQWPIHTFPVLVGRTGDVRIESDDSVSGKHCEIREESGVFLIRDLNSRNETLLNGVPIQRETKLEQGDRITIGSTEMKVTWPT